MGGGYRHHKVLRPRQSRHTMGRIAQVIRDKRMFHLIGKYLRRGAMVEGVVIASAEGTRLIKYAIMPDIKISVTENPTRCLAITSVPTLFSSRYA
jgi:hypothetical protein